MKLDTVVANKVRVFVSSRISKVLLAVPGCAEKKVNRAHLKEFGNDFSVASGISDVVDSLARRGEHKVSHSSGQPCLCYCEKVKSPLAFRSEVCVFEAARTKLQETRGTPQSTLGCFKWEVDKHDRSRQYSVFRVHSRWFRLNGEKSNIMEAWLLPLGRATIRIYAPDAERAFQRIQMSASLNGNSIMDESIRLKPDEGYRQIDRALADAIVDLKSGKRLNKVHETVDKRVRSLGDAIDYHGVAGFLAWLFSPCNNDPLSAIQLARLRLYDALALFGTGEFIRKLEHELNNRRTQVISSHLEPMIQSSLADALLPFSQLEAKDNDELSSYRKESLPVAEAISSKTGAKERGNRMPRKTRDEREEEILRDEVDTFLRDLDTGAAKLGVRFDPKDPVRKHIDDQIRRRFLRAAGLST